MVNPSRIRWLLRDGRKNDRLDARKLATPLYLGQLPTVHLPRAEVSAWRALIAPGSVQEGDRGDGSEGAVRVLRDDEASNGV